MFISTPTQVHRSSVKVILKLLRHVSVFSHQPQDLTSFELIKYNTAVAIQNTILLYFINSVIHNFS